MSPLGIIFIIFSVVCAFIDSRFIDSILKYLYETDKDLWNSLDRPAGIRWEPEESDFEESEIRRSFWGVTKSNSSKYAGLILMWGMMFCTPEWLKNNTKLKRRLIACRIFSVEWLIFFYWIVFQMRSPDL